MRRVHDVFEKFTTEAPPFFMNKVVQFGFMFFVCLSFTVVAAILLPSTLVKMGLFLSVMALIQIVRYGYIIYAGKWLYIPEGRIEQVGTADQGFIQSILQTEEKMLHGKREQTGIIFADLSTGDIYSTYIPGNRTDIKEGSLFEALLPSRYTYVNGIRYVDNLYYMQPLIQRDSPVPEYNEEPDEGDDAYERTSASA